MKGKRFRNLCIIMILALFFTANATCISFAKAYIDSADNAYGNADTEASAACENAAGIASGDICDSANAVNKKIVTEARANNDNTAIACGNKVVAAISLKSPIIMQTPPPKRATVPVQISQSIKENKLKSYSSMLKGSVFLPENQSVLELYVSTAPGKPAQKPISPRVVSISSRPGKTSLKARPTAAYYTKASSGVFIEQNGDRRRWFAYRLKNGTGTAKVVWQVSNLPFDGKTNGWKMPEGLVASGEVNTITNEAKSITSEAKSITSKTNSITSEAKSITGDFMIDFGKLRNSQTNIKSLVSNLYKPITQYQRFYYVRAVPVDSKGEFTGKSPGRGIAVVYGKPVYNSEYFGKAVPGTCELWTTSRTYLGEYSGEFQDRPKKYAEVGVSPKDTGSSKLFNFSNLPANSTNVIIQISDRPFSSSEVYPSGKKYLYEKIYPVPVTESGLPLWFPKSNYPSSVLVPFTQFGKKAAEMKEEEYVKYYVRGIWQRPSQTPGYIDTGYTNTIIVNYGYGKPVQLYQPPVPKYEYINKSIPDIRIKNYTPVQWAASDYLQHFYVYRAPSAAEIKCLWMNSQTKEILYPYDDFFGKNYYKAQGITNAQQYEQKIIPRVLKPGNTVYFPPPKEEDKEWYEELYDGIVDFFKNLASIASQLVNQVSSAYNSLKTGLINYVAELCPVPSLKGAFKTALEGLVNYGLVAVGLPPTLPNFDELSSMSLDYLSEVALTEAGIPADAITKAVVAEVSKGIGEEIKKAANHSDPNPVNSPFLKLDPAFMYRPAYVDIEISNPSIFYTVPGSFNFDVTFEFDYYNMYANNYDPYDGIAFTSDNPYLPGSSAALNVSSAYMEHFIYGLNGNTVNFKNGEKAVYDVFIPVRGQKIPVLQPNEIRNVRLYLTPYSFYGGGVLSRYPTGDQLLSNDFGNMYFGNGNKKFNNFYLSGVFPTALEFMNSDGRTYIQTDPKVQLVYKRSGATSDTAKEKPVNTSWSK